MHTTLSLREYRSGYPSTASVPTLTQSRLLAFMLDSKRCQAAILDRRHARRSARLSAFRNAVRRLWRALIPSFGTLRRA